jgi:hypothetical protein
MTRYLTSTAIVLTLGTAAFANPVTEANWDAANVKPATASEEMEDHANTAMDRPMLKAPQVERDGYSAVMHDALNTEDLTGARVYSIDDEDIGEVSELLLTSDGQIDRAVIDVGGFLGLGEHPVALTMDELKVVKSNDEGYFRVYVDTTQAALEQQPAYEG